MFLKPNMVTGFISASAIAITTLLFSSPSYALSSITWNLQNFQFTNGTTASGTFTTVYDANAAGSSANIVTSTAGSNSTLNTVYYVPDTNNPNNPLGLFGLQFYNSADPTKGITINFGETFAQFQAQFPVTNSQNYQLNFSSGALTYTTNNTNYNQSALITGSVYTVIQIPFAVPGGSTIPAIGGILALCVMRRVKQSASLNNRITDSVK
jgi:hypothetical protein